MAESDSDRYEFDAPSHVVDLKELDGTDIDDRWFEQQAEGAACSLITPQRLTRSGPPGDSSAPPPQTDQDPGSTRPGSPPTNLVTLWGGGGYDKQGARPKQRTVHRQPAEPRRVPKRRGVSQGLTAAPPPKKHKEPSSSEDRELERIRSLQEEVAQHRRKNEASYKMALAGQPPPKKVLLLTTVPIDFSFNKEPHVKASSSGSSHKEVDFIRQLRQPSSPAKARRGATVPKPFNLSLRSSRAAASTSSAYVPMAQRVEQFHTQIPNRYHVQSRKAHDKGPSSIKRDQLKLTHPHSPQLMTRDRSRGPPPKGSAQLEAEELDKQMKYKIRPVELNMKILQSVESLKKPAVKDFTVPEGFEMEIDKRLQERQSSRKEAEGEKPYNFRARPVPKDLLEGVLGLPAKKVAEPTVPESPAFALKHRVRVERKVDQVKPPPSIKALPAPPPRPPMELRPMEHHQTEVCPFSFEQREKEKKKRQEEKHNEEEEEEEEEVPQFKAQPLPSFKTVLLPEKRRAEPTKPEPFRLLVEERGAMKTSYWDKMVQEEQKHQEEMAVFKARPNTVTHKVPFKPISTNKPALALEPFHLATEQRAREWQEFEQMASEKEALRLRMEADRKREEEQAEEQEVSRLRQEQVHKAQPIRHYKPVAVKKSDVPPTVPESPNFSERFRH